ncbi:uncharacterized protein EV422DRAFT_165852 [Fimicolochytrium jonesii]|uniref:uncharacterized protein n=1 Tax=Fimicolochytrium jonesii TaxID=1396493 RepID=UPI0022FE2C57|nr:uncharacterized protein EV422DRAFT_165852 [Fimicolochytrium jonesii]KAI8818807.1 hypothetical protein EV422DRAFT_165852 [Fimicolochytrium jonesii]
MTNASYSKVSSQHALVNYTLLITLAAMQLSLFFLRGYLKGTGVTEERLGVCESYGMMVNGSVIMSYRMYRTDDGLYLVDKTWEQAIPTTLEGLSTVTEIIECFFLDIKSRIVDMQSRLSNIVQEAKARTGRRVRRKRSFPRQTEPAVMPTPAKRR